MSSKLGDLSPLLELPDETYKSLIDELFQILLHRKGVNSEDSQWGNSTALPSLSPTESQNVYAALIESIYESCRQDLLPSQFITIFEDIGLEEKRIKYLAKQYEKTKTKIRNYLSLTSSLALPQIVDLSWRLDYHVKSVDSGNNDEFLYFLEYKVQYPDGQIRPLSMTCSYQQLQSIFFKCQGAMKQLDHFTKNDTLGAGMKNI